MRERWEQDDGYIRGLAVTQSLSDDRRRIAEPIKPEITIKGLEYLTENNKGAMEAVKQVWI